VISSGTNNSVPPCFEFGGVQEQRLDERLVSETQAIILGRILIDGGELARVLDEHDGGRVKKTPRLAL